MPSPRLRLSIFKIGKFSYTYPWKWPLTNSLIFSLLCACRFWNSCKALYFTTFSPLGVMHSKKEKKHLTLINVCVSLAWIPWTWAHIGLELRLGFCWSWCLLLRSHNALIRAMISKLRGLSLVSSKFWYTVHSHSLLSQCIYWILIHVHSLSVCIQCTYQVFYLSDVQIRHLWYVTQ